MKLLAYFRSVADKFLHRSALAEESIYYRDASEEGDRQQTYAAFR